MKLPVLILLIFMMVSVSAQSPTTKELVKDLKKNCTYCPEMVTIPGGKFRMGGTEPVNTPQHEVNIKYSFAVSKYEITLSQFEEFVVDYEYEKILDCRCYSGRGNIIEVNWKNPGFPQAGDHPVVCVSWMDAQRYVRWLSEKTGYSFRLLTEAEWEFLARTGKQSLSNGNFGKEDKGWTNSMDKWLYTAPVNELSPDENGLYGLNGNAMEWMADCVNGNYNGAPIDGHAWTTAEDIGVNWGNGHTTDGQCLDRITRGLSWRNTSEKEWYSSRGWWRSDWSFDWIGFRIAVTIEDE